jgi:hypothetical protein
MNYAICGGGSGKGTGAEPSASVVGVVVKCELPFAITESSIADASAPPAISTASFFMGAVPPAEEPMARVESSVRAGVTYVS